MPTWSVHDAADPRLASFAALPQRGTGGDVVVEGEIAVARALEGPHPLRALLLTAAHRARLQAKIPASLPVYEATPALLREVVGFDFHRGCVAVMERPAAVDPAALVRAKAGRAQACTVLVAEALADPANLGAVIRNARAFGADLVLHGGGADPWSRRAIRASMGLVFGQPLALCTDLPGEIVRLREVLSPKARVIAATLEPGATPLSRYSAPRQRVLLVGNEGQGLSATLRAQADEAVTIPLVPGVDSLNVAAATAVLLWALRSPSEGNPPAEGR